MSMHSMMFDTAHHALNDAHNDHDCAERLRSMTEELQEQSPMVSAAMMTATAFRLRDEAGLITALRCLVNAVEQFEELAAANDA